MVEPRQLNSFYYFLEIFQLFFSNQKVKKYKEREGNIRQVSLESLHI